MIDVQYMSDLNAKSIGGLIESLNIFAKYALKGLDESYVLQAEHDIIYGPSLPPLRSELGQRLEALGWHWDEDVECWGMFT